MQSTTSYHQLLLAMYGGAYVELKLQIIMIVPDLNQNKINVYSLLMPRVADFFVACIQTTF